MNTKVLMICSAITMTIVGLGCLFLPQEIAGYFNAETLISPLIIQILSSLYLGFAILNWTSKANLIGGIYSKPVAIGNFMHYMVGTLVCLKFFMAHVDLNLMLIPLILYAIFAILFGKVTFGSPI